MKMLSKSEAMITLLKLIIKQPLARRATMAKKKDNTILRVVHPVCCGIDVHKEKLSACLAYGDDGEGNPLVEIREFGTFTDELVLLREWLLEHDCPVMAMESTGIYWRPVHNVLEGYLEVILVNARHVKKVPGRKTDISDSQWLSGLLRHGLLRGSFIPPREVREWRDLTRLRKKHVETVGNYRRRVHKLFESANIKIDSVVSDLFGVTGRNLMNLLVSGGVEITMEEVEKCIRGKLKGKKEDIYRSIQGFFTEHHRWLLAQLLRTIQTLEVQIEDMNMHLRELMSDHEELIGRLDEVAGVNEIAGRAIVAEVGTDMKSFPTSGSICSWSGVCPGNNESAGKRHSGRSSVMKHPLKTILVEVAWAAVRVKGSYYHEKYYRLKARRGSKKAIIAIAHRILKAIYHIIKDGVRFRDLGEEYLLRRSRKGRLLRLQKQARTLGYQLVATPVNETVR
jgi:transposase